MKKNSIVQGDGYVLPIVITAGSVFITDRLATAVRIKIGKYSAIWPGGKISYSNQKWFFPLTQEQTQELSSGQNEYQVQVQFKNGETVGTKPQNIFIQKSVLRGTFGEELSATEPSGFIEPNQLNACIADVNIEVLDYLELDNKPQINGVELLGNKSTRELGLTPDWDQSDETAKDYIKNRMGGYTKHYPAVTHHFDIDSAIKVIPDPDYPEEYKLFYKISDDFYYISDVSNLSITANDGSLFTNLKENYRIINNTKVIKISGWNEINDDRYDCLWRIREDFDYVGTTLTAGVYMVAEYWEGAPFIYPETLEIEERDVRVPIPSMYLENLTFNGTPVAVDISEVGQNNEDGAIGLVPKRGGYYTLNAINYARSPACHPQDIDGSTSSIWFTSTQSFRKLSEVTRDEAYEQLYWSMPFVFYSGGGYKLTITSISKANTTGITFRYLNQNGTISSFTWPASKFKQ